MTTTWLGQIRNGDNAAWDKLVRVYRKLVLWWCLKGDVPAAEADDVCQEVFVAIQRGIVKYRHESFRAWLWTITKSKITDHWRNQSTLPVTGIDGIDGLLNQVECESERKVENVTQATKVLFDEVVSLVKGEFNETHWRAFWMRLVEGRTAAEIADELGVTRTVVHNATSRIRRRIHEAFTLSDGT